YSSWTPQRFASAVEEYRRFLALCRLYPTIALIPGRDVDTIWHRHILNTERYMVDCQAYFGYYLHHRPHSRIESVSEQPNEAWLRTLRLYEEVFGCEPAEGWLNGQAICNGGCDTSSCSPGEVFPSGELK